MSLNNYLYIVIGVILVLIAIMVVIIIAKKKKPNTNQQTNYEKKLQRKKDNDEEKEVKSSIKTINNNIKSNNKKRRELGKMLTFTPMDELIPIKRGINKGIDGFEYQDNLGFFDIVKVVSFDYSSMDEDDLNMHIFYWDRFYRTTSNSIKRLSLNMPVDTTLQINYYKQVLRRTDNPLYRSKIEKEINELRGFENRQTRDYYLFYYADDLDSLMNISAHISASLEDRDYVIRISPLKKLQILNKLSNPYSYKNMLTESFI